MLFPLSLILRNYMILLTLVFPEVEDDESCLASKMKSLVE